MKRHRPVLIALAMLLAPTILRAPANAGSKVPLAAIGDAAPGGGVFAGPSFVGWPAAGGDGWLAFRSTVEGGSSSEVLVAAHMTAPVTRVEVARLGLALPNGDRLKQFIGRPAINAQGDVAFFALLTPAAPSTEPDAPDAAGVFLFRQSPAAGEPQLMQVAASGQRTPAGALDLATPVDLLADANTVDTPDRTPALNDAGDVAFVSAVIGGPQDVGAIFLLPAGAGTLTPIVAIGSAFDGGRFAILGPPALNNHGVIAFHGFVEGAAPIDGIFLFSAGTPSLIVRDGLLIHEDIPLPNDQPLLEFGDPVALDDQGAVVFTAGPLFDPSPDAPVDDEGSPGVLVYRAGVVDLLAYPGQPTAQGRVTGITLGAVAGSVMAAPSINPNGAIAFFVSINGGSTEAILRRDPSFLGLQRVVAFGTATGDATPAGGRYSFAESAPAIDATGAVSFFARVTGGVTSDALVYLPLEGAASAVVVGAGAPSSRGFYAGPPFSSPVCNDRGDVVFRSFLAQDPASIGIFRVRDGATEALVRAGDASPRGAPFLDFQGDPNLNADGLVAFAAVVDGLARGIYVTDGSGTYAIAVRGDPAPGTPGATFSGLGVNPSVNDRGEIAFRGNARSLDPLTLEPTNQEGLFLADAAGLHALVLTGQPSPTGVPFFKLRDPVAGAAGVVFRATLGVSEGTTDGLFLVTPQGASSVAVAGDEIGDGTTLTGFTGKPTIDAAGHVAFQATRARAGRPLGPAIVRRTDAGFEIIAAQGMYGPAGGIIKGLGQPSMSSTGHMVFRASFMPQTGGTPGFLLFTETGLRPFLSIGEYALSHSSSRRKHDFARLTSFGPRGSLNARDELSFIGNVSGSAGRNGVYVAAPATLSARRLTLRVSDRERSDRIRFQVVLRPGGISNGLDPGREPLTLSLGDGTGTLWSVTLPAGTLKRHGRTFVAALDGTLRKQLRSVRLNLSARGAAARVAVASAPVDLTFLGLRPLKPPFSLVVQIGDDAAVAAVPCSVDARIVRCSS